ncbi:MAG TPA: PDZ domain-containing protein [Clostridiales bacterium]|nr:PDZ domain-containing protein [Clostridiales bacterium]
MNYYEFDEKQYKKRNNIWKYIAIAIIFALIGAMVTYYTLVVDGENAKIKENEKILESEEQKGDEVTENKETPQIGAKGDIYISSDNPVVEIAEKVGPTVVGITSRSEIVVRDFFFEERVEEQEAYGSGIIISEDGYIVTNYHVIEGAKELYAILPDGDTIEAELVGGDKRSEVAVLKIDPPDDLPVAILGDSDSVKQGELVVAIGNPLGHQLAGTVTAGIISAVDRSLTLDDGRTMKLLQTDAAISPGNSGGALVNANGEVIGMNTLKINTTYTGAEGLGFAIPSNDFAKTAAELIEKGMVERPGIGILGREITEEYAKELGYPQGIGVVRVMPNGPAHKAGIIPGDVIIGLDGKEVKTFDELSEIIKEHKVGDVVKIKIWRDGEELTIPIKLEQMQD